MLLWVLVSVNKITVLNSIELLNSHVAMYQQCRLHRLGYAPFLVFAWRGRYEQAGLSQLEEGEMASPMWLHHGKLDSCFHHSVQVTLIRLKGRVEVTYANPQNTATER